jgi:nucleotide-binding universal stress UspA family protein
MTDTTGPTAMTGDSSESEDRRAVVVGVGPEGHLADGTVRFVADTAERLDLAIELVHVVPDVFSGGLVAWDVRPELARVSAEARTGLVHAEALLRDHVGREREVRADLVHADPVASLVHRSRGAALVVLERRRRGRWERIAEGSVTAGVAARAHAPVVSVPTTWQPPEAPGPITVGVEDPSRSGSELWVALGLAAADDRAVRVLRAVHLPDAYQDVLRREGRAEAVLAQARAELAREVGLPDSARERVPCSFDVVWGSATDVLLAAGAEASLLVLARRDPLLPFGSHLGQVVRAVLRNAACPVMVVEPGPAAPDASPLVSRGELVADRSAD